MKICYYNNVRGYTTMVSVLVVGAIGTAVAVSLLLFGIDAAKISVITEQATQASALADSCAQEGLEQIRVLSSYTGTGGLGVSPNTCTYTVTDLGGSVKKLNATGVIGTITKKAQVLVTRTSTTMDITSWQEVSDF